jgi:hypothetical protein
MVTLTADQLATLQDYSAGRFGTRRTIERLGVRAAHLARAGHSPAALAPSRLRSRSSSPIRRR